MGNVTQRQNNNVGLTENFYYDNLYRLDHSTLGSTTNLQMCYDNTGGACTANLAGMGNITSRSDIASGAAWTYDPVHKHQATQAGDTSHTYTYDANGNAATRNGTMLGWTSYNYPESVATATESASFDYGADRQRWRMIYAGPSGTETTFYATPAFEAVITSSGTDYRHYIYANGRPVVVISRTTAGAVNVRSLLVDHQGSLSSLVTDSAGTTDVSESFTAYGNRREASTWTGAPTSAERTTMDGVTRQGYTFQTVLGSMGLNHMNGRVEDAITGRFLSADPTVSDPGNTQTYNRYSYVNNNPLTYTDPTGFEPASPQPIDPCGDTPVGCGYDTSATPELFPPVVVNCTVCCGSTSSCWSVNPQFTNLENVLPAPSVGGGAGDGSKSLPPEKLAPIVVTAQSQRQAFKIGCDTTLPDGSTVGDTVNSVSNDINDRAQLVPTPYSPVMQIGNGSSLVAVATDVYSGTNARRKFRADSNFLGDVGNFEYFAVSNDIGVPQTVAEIVAGAYQYTARGGGESFGPYGMDRSATSQANAGYNSTCVKH